MRVRHPSKCGFCVNVICRLRWHWRRNLKSIHITHELLCFLWSRPLKKKKTQHCDSFGTFTISVCQYFKCKLSHFTCAKRKQKCHSSLNKNMILCRAVGRRGGGEKDRVKERERESERRKERERERWLLLKYRLSGVVVCALVSKVEGRLFKARRRDPLHSSSG